MIVLGGDDYVLARRELGDGRVLDVTPLLFDRARLSIGPAGSGVYDDEW